MRKTFGTFKTVLRTSGAEPEITISTSSVDRDGDIIDPSGMDASHYLKNPVILFGHDHYALPIGRTKSLNVDGDGIRAKFAWLENDSDAARVRNAFEQGVLNAASIGFLPQKWEDIENTYGRRYTKWQLLEWSIVPVPSNPEAVRTLKSLGLSVPSRKQVDITAQADALDQVLSDLKSWRRKSGRVLSADNGQSIRAAIDSLEVVLAKLDGNDDKEFFTLDDANDEIPDELVAEVLASMLPQVVKETLTAHINRITGRVD